MTTVRRIVGLFVLISAVEISGQRSAAPVVAIDPDDVGGVVTSTRGPEAGV